VHNRSLLVQAVVLTFVLTNSLHAAAPDLTGNWVAEVAASTVSNGVPNYFRFTLRQTDFALAGELRAIPVSGSVKPDGAFELTVRTQTWSGKITGEELIATTVSTDSSQQALSVRAWREKEPQSQRRTHDFVPNEFHRLFSGRIAPALRIFPGDTVKTITVDAVGFDSYGVRRSAGGNPQTGPFYIEGALPGDTLAIRLTRIQLNRDTATTTSSLSAIAILASFLVLVGVFRNTIVVCKFDG
jgi:hypothetical protein